MQSYHWFTEIIEELSNDARESKSDNLLLGLSSVIDTFATEADLPIEDQERLSQLQCLAATSKGSKKIQQLRTSMA